MSEISRKRFLGLGAAAAPGASGCDTAPEGFTVDTSLAPDLIVHGGTISIVDDDRPRPRPSP